MYIKIPFANTFIGLGLETVWLQKKHTSVLYNIKLKAWNSLKNVGIGQMMIGRILYG